MMDIVKETEKHLEQIINGTPYVICDVEYVKEGPNWYLRVYVDKEGGVTLDDCEFVSRRLEKILDSEDYIEKSYILEVSSPGINRKLKSEADFVKYRENIVDIKLYKPLNGQKQYQGKLKDYQDGCVTVELPDGSLAVFAIRDLACVRLAVL